MKIHEYNQMMAYLTRQEPPSLPPVASGEQRESFAEGDIAKAPELSKGLKEVYEKYVPKIKKGTLTGLKVLGTPAVSTALYVTDVVADLKKTAEKGNLTAKKALDALVGQGEKGLYFLLPELAKDAATSPIANKILQLGKIGKFATPVGLGLSAAGVGKDFYDQYKAFEALSPEEKEKRIKESTYTPTEQDFQMMQEAESRASAAKGGMVERENYGLAGFVKGPISDSVKIITKAEDLEREGYTKVVTPGVGGFGSIKYIKNEDTTGSLLGEPPTVQERYNKYLSESGTKSNTSDLENRYRELIRPTSATGLPVSIPTPVNEGPTPIKSFLSFTSPQGEKIGFTGLMGFVRPNGEPYTGPVPEDIQNMTRMLAAEGGRISFAEGSNEIQIPTLTKKPTSSIYGKYASQIANSKIIERGPKQKGKLGPEDPLSKYESYSEEELAGNIEAKKPNFDTLEDYILQTMPIFEPKDVAPSKSYSPMPVEEYLRRRYQIDLAKGGPSNPSKIRKIIK
jgi:hypothetical protein